MEESDADSKPVVVDPPLYNEAPPSAAQRRAVVVAAVAGAPPAENHLIQRIQRALVELRELRNQFNAILRELELEGLFVCVSSSYYYSLFVFSLFVFKNWTI